MMNNIMQYKGYIGSVELSEEDSVLFGQLLGIRSLITYEGTTAEELIKDFRGAVDDYLESCKADGTKPEKPYKGNTNLRFKPDTYRRMAVYTIRNGQSLNSFVETACEEKLSRLNA